MFFYIFRSESITNTDISQPIFYCTKHSHVFTFFVKISIEPLILFKMNEIYSFLCVLSLLKTCLTRQPQRQNQIPLMLLSHHVSPFQLRHPSSLPSACPGCSASKWGWGRNWSVNSALRFLMAELLLPSEQVEPASWLKLEVSLHMEMLSTQISYPSIQHTSYERKMKL